MVSPERVAIRQNLDQHLRTGRQGCLPAGRPSSTRSSLTSGSRLYSTAAAFRHCPICLPAGSKGSLATWTYQTRPRTTTFGTASPSPGGCSTIAGPLESVGAPCGPYRWPRVGLSADRLNRLRSGPSCCHAGRWATIWHGGVSKGHPAIASPLRAASARGDAGLACGLVRLRRLDGHVEGRDTKNRRTATLPLRGATAALLQAALAKTAPEAPAFSLPSKYDMAGMLTEDLKAAGIDTGHRSAG